MSLLFSPALMIRLHELIYSVSTKYFQLKSFFKNLKTKPLSPPIEKKGPATND